MIHQKLFQPIDAGFFLIISQGRYVSGRNTLICFKIHNFSSGFFGGGLVHPFAFIDFGNFGN